MFADNAIPGRLAIARLSLLVFASALSAAAAVFEGIEQITERLPAIMSAGSGVPSGPVVA
jgi:hypothetical protein